MAKRKALGKGLGALIPEVAPSGDEGRLLEIDLDLISPNPDQPRQRFGEESLRELAASIRSVGVVQPLVVRRAGEGYQIVIGERRWRAAQTAGLRRVPALLHDTDDGAALELALVENLHREDLNPLEEASAYRMLVERLGLTQEEVAERVGRKRSTVANTLRLLRLHDDVKGRLAAGAIEMGHARAMLALEEPTAQRDLCREVVRRGLSVRQVEKKVREIQIGAGGKGVEGAAGGRRAAPPVDAFIADAERRLSRSIEAPVTIRPGKKGGTITISYASDDDLQRLFELLLGRR